MVRVPLLAAVRRLVGVLLSTEGLTEKGFDLAVWLFNIIYSIRQKEASLEDELEKIGKIIVGIRALLEDADKSRRIEKESVKKWLRDLYSLSLDAYDLLDLVRTWKDDAAAAPTTVLNPRKRKFSWPDLLPSWRRKISDLFPSSAYQCSSSTPEFLFRLSVAVEATAIQSRLEEISKTKKQLRLQPGVVPSITAGGTPSPTASALNADDIVGMAIDRQKIIDLLLQGGPHPRAPMVVAIKGMGGSGKTTLARCTCNDERVRKRFGVRIWIDVMEDHGVETITGKMLESLGEQSRFCNFDTSQRRLMDLVSGKLLLMVLDNVEDGFLRSWDTVRAALSAVAPGSTVLVTTRSDKVSREIADSTQYLQGLSEGEWLQLFTAKTGDLDDHPDLQELAGRMAHRCQMSPFAAKCLGSLLSGCRDVQIWESILGQGPSGQGDDEIKKMLLKSYDLLALDLKRCFAFCAIFPEDCIFDRVEVAKLWASLGFVGMTRSPEAVGRQQFDKLKSSPSSSRHVPRRRWRVAQTRRIGTTECRV